MNIQLSLLPFLFFFSLTHRAFSDMVYLKNGDNIEGIIEKEEIDMLTLNVGYGKLALLKKDIKNIKRYSLVEQNDLRQRWSSKYFMRPEFITDDLKVLAKDFDDLENLRELGVRNKKEKDRVIKSLEKLESQLKGLNAQLAVVSEKLSSAKSQDSLVQYNALVNEFNSLIANIKSTELNKDSLQKEVVSLDKRVSGYINDFWLFRKKIMGRVDALNDNLKQENRYLLRGIKKELEVMETDFTKHAIDFEKFGLGIMVEVLLNDITKANLIVDTGASLIIISRELADKLGVGLDTNDSTIMVSLADGRQVQAFPIILKSVKVGNLLVKNVKAAVLINSLPTQEDGLLGMSFLENFIVKIDANAKRLIFEEFNPQ